MKLDGNANPSLTIHLRWLDLSEKKPTENALVGSDIRVVELLTHRLHRFSSENIDRVIRAGPQVQSLFSKGFERVTESARDGNPMLFVERSVVGPRKQLLPHFPPRLTISSHQDTSWDRRVNNALGNWLGRRT